MFQPALCVHRRQLLLAAALLALAPPLRAAEPEVLVTLLNGDARVLDRQGSHAATAGLKLAGAAIVQTGAQTQLLRLEWAGGTAADLGPDTQVLVAPPGLADRNRPALYLLRGWLKLTAAADPANEPAPLVLSLFAATQLNSGAVVHFVGRGLAWVLEESGMVQVSERPPRGAPVSLTGGQLFSRNGAEPGQVLPRAPSTMLREVPRTFRDTLPRRFAALRASPAAPRELPPPSYAELREWLGGETTVRRYLATQFEHWAREPALRQALASKDHPEWAAVLNPDRARRP